ncbi:MAG TPA: ferric reductase-like transmembrane domain-containing protein [Actinomycetes bacterium]
MTTGSPLWYLARGTGVVSLALLTATVLLGLTSVTRWRSARWPRFVTVSLHRNISLLSVVFLVVHIGSSVLDTYTKISLTDAFVPFVGSYRPFWLGLGALAFDLILALIVTSLIRVRLGLRIWRSVHWLAYAAWPVAVLHGLGTGTDASQRWMQLFTLTCIGLVGLAGLRRLVVEDADDAPVVVLAARERAGVR